MWASDERSTQSQGVALDHAMSPPVQCLLPCPSTTNGPASRLSFPHTTPLLSAGMGIHVLRNFASGGDWILQEALTNSALLSELLPPGVPLSTLRVVTASRHGLGGAKREQRPPRPRSRPGESVPSGSGGGPVTDGCGSAAEGGPAGRQSSASEFSVLTVVLRAGRVGALTDHDCVCFPVDAMTGVLAEGRSNQARGPRRCLGNTWGA